MNVRERLGDYELLHALKSGGMGDVLLARRRGPSGFEQLVAIKTVRAQLAAAPLARAMFLDEARLLARLTHPGIAQILDFGEADGVAFMVMEYVAGLSFRGLADLRPPPAVVCQAVADACRGLHAAHELRDLVDGHLLGVVHRDISPDNLMVGYDARVKVLDFGIALVRGRQAPVTELGTVKGKPPYMSPEQLKNQPIDRRSDVFSTAVVLWELVTGRPLFEGDSIYAVARAVEHQPIVAPSTLAGPLPDELDDVILAGLARDPDRRLATAAAMAEVLERIAAAAGTESLEAWAERALGGPRESHRGWLSRILGGERGERALGRPTGAQTALDGLLDEPSGTDQTMLAARSGLDAPVEAPPGEAPIGPPRVPPTEPLAMPPVGDGRELRTEAVVTRGRRGWIAIALFLLGLGAGAWWLRAHGCAPGAGALDAGAPDAAVVGPGALDAGALDAAMVAPIDATPADAAPRRRDAGTTPDRPSPLDAARPPPIDAAPVARVDAASRGTGTLRIGELLPAARITIDGMPAGETPLLGKRLEAGHHVVVLTDPSTGAVVRQVELDLEPGQTYVIRAR